MKIRITKEGLYGNGPIAIGTELNVKGQPPAGWADKYIVIGEDAPAGAEFVAAKPESAEKADPIKKLDRADIIAKLDKAGWDGDKRQSTEKLAVVLAGMASK